MATITPVAINTTGEALTFTAATAGGDTINTTNKPTRLHIINGSASPITVTLTGVIPCSQGSTHNAVNTIAASTTEELQIPAHCIDPVTGHVAVGYSSVTTVTVAATQ